MTRERATPHLQFFGGKGGVGKTTCAAAASIRLAEKGRRVLVISTDPAHSLGDALATRLGAQPKRIAMKRGALFAVELDDEAALARWLGQRQGALHTIAARGTYLDDEDIDALFRLSLPGVDELIGLLEITRLARAAPYDDVIVDTAPTGHTLRLLAMPETLKRIAAVLDTMQAKHRFLSESLGRGYRKDRTDRVIDEIDEEARALEALLGDEGRCAFHWVMLPEQMSLEESVDGVTALEALGIDVRELIVNRVTASPQGRCALCEGKVRAEAQVLHAINARFGGKKIRVLPVEEREPRGVAALRVVGQRLAAKGRASARVKPPSSARAASAGAPRKTPAHLSKTDARDPVDLIAPPGVRLVLFGGKGGVGKTTCAAAFALRLAARRPKAKILLLSTDPAHSLADALAVPLGDDERKIPGAPPRLRARELDAPRAFEAQRDRYRRAVDDLFDALAGGSRFDATYDRAVVADLMDLAPPGIDEIFGMLGLTDALVPTRTKRAPFDLVVVDTAPTGHTLRLLAMPEAALEWVHALLAILLKYRKVTGLGELAADLMEIARELRELIAMLQDARRTRFVAVTRAAELPRAETVRLLKELARLRIATGAIFVNAVTPPGCARCTRRARVEATELARLRSAARSKATRAMLLGRAVSPPPRGRIALERWARTWTSP